MTWDRDKPLVKQGWVTAQQGTIDVQTLRRRKPRSRVAQANIVAQEAQLQVLHQQKIYQSVVAPFDGVITQRNIDIGSLVQADATSGTFMFTLMQSNVIRTQVYVPQDEAFGVRPGVEAVVRVPEMPGSQLSRQGDAHRRRAAARHAHAADRDRHSQSRRRAVAGHLLHGRAAHSAQDAELDRCRPTPSSSSRRRCRSRWSRTAWSHLRKVAVARDLGTEVEVQRRRQGGRPGDPQSRRSTWLDGSKVRIRAPATLTP